MRSILMPLVAASVASVALSGCATKKYVGREVGEINLKVDTLSGEMEKTQERVKRSIALNRIAVISYGETKPVVDNKTRDHRAQNRRVVINVLE